MQPAPATVEEVHVSHGEHPANPTLADGIRRATGINAARCYQCGKCSAGCPMASEMSLRPHDILRLIQQDRKQQLLADEAIWLCLTCETCTARCPNEVDPARVIDALREISLGDPEAAAAPRKIRAFHESFLKQIRRSGRIFEFGLVAGYKMRSGALFDDVSSAPGLLRRGKLPLTPRRIRAVPEIRRIFEFCQAAENEAEEP